MNQKSRKSIVQQIVSLANSAITEQEQINQIMKDYTSLPETPFRLIRSINAEGIVFMLVDNAINEYEKLLGRLLQQEGWQEKFSAEYLSKAMQRILTTLLKEGKTTESAGRLFDHLTEEFDNYSREYIIYVPLAGISLYTDSFPMGKITFRKMTDAYITDLFDRMKAITMLTLNPAEEKEANVSWTKQRLDSLQGTVCAEFYDSAEPQRARERAEEEVRHVLDLLRYAISVLSSRNLNIAVGTARLLTEELINRVALKERVKNLYGARSGVSHGGEKAILESDLADLRSIAKELIFQMIERKDEFPTHRALLKWL